MTSVNAVGGFPTQYQKELEHLLNKQTNYADTAKLIGGKLENAEEALLKALSSDNPDQGKIQALKMQYDRMVRVFETFQKIIESAHQLIMRLISRISSR